MSLQREEPPQGPRVSEEAAGLQREAEALRAAILALRRGEDAIALNHLREAWESCGYRDRVGIVAHWRQRLAHAAERPQGRLLVLLGDFNIAEHPPESLDAPVDADAAPA